MKLLAHYQALADLFEYPDIKYPQQVRKIIDLLDGNYPEAVADLERFLELLPDRELRTMQELFTRSFDVQAITTLDIGYVLFGDDYKRGE
jgi:nitrate reductase assembly molybdenum cofactor insertion protein NarJ